jgi:hypothetical protein
MMSFQTLLLSHSLIANLYKKNILISEEHSLSVNTVSHEQSVTTQKNTTTPSLGGNRKKVSIVVGYPGRAYLPDDSLQFLTAILQACKLTLDDVAIINHYGQDFSFKHLQETFDCHFLLIFGVDETQLSLPPTSHFLITNIENCRLITAPALDAMNHPSEAAKLLKSKLWLCLKQVFN